MHDTHFPTDGELKESLLRHVIRKYAPEHIKILKLLVVLFIMVKYVLIK